MSNQRHILKHVFKLCCGQSCDNLQHLKGAVDFIIKTPTLHHIAPLALREISKNQDIDTQNLKLIAFQVVANYLAKRQAVLEIGNVILKHELDINLVLLKSMALNDRIYDPSYPRGSSDIDILVHKKDIKVLERCLDSLGYVKRDPGIQPFSGAYEVSWSKGKVHIDVHTSLANPYKFKINVDSLISDSEPHPFYNNRNIRVLSKKDTLWNLALHFQKDCYTYHHSILDAHHVINTDVSKIDNVYEAKKAYNVFESIKNNLVSDAPMPLMSSLLVSVMPLCKENKKTLRFRLNQCLVDFLTLDSKIGFARYYLIYMIKFVKNKFINL